jgi:acyl-coenzyme A synthetase/AMP-(fatty) acid ligase
MNAREIFQQGDLDRPWILSGDGGYSAGEILAAAQELAECVPDHQYCIMMCESRVHFMTGFLAAQIRGQHVLLPSSRAPAAIESIVATWPDSYCLVESIDTRIGVEQFECRPDFDRSGTASSIPEVLSDRPAVTLFTSGSTGTPKPNEKSWGDMLASAERIQARFGIGADDTILATVMPQHMFGFETSVMLPIHSGARVVADTPLYPEDIRLVLKALSGEATLITTPVHLRAFPAADPDWPRVRQVISATAPLSRAIAADNEARLGGPVYEIFGSTEHGAIASRQTVNTQTWSMLEPLELVVNGTGPAVRDAGRGIVLEMRDNIRRIDSRTFEFIGRAADLVKVGGKRASLADLNLKLTSIEGVVDGVYVTREAEHDTTARLAAIVVAPGISDQDITRALTHQIDAVFLPRPIYRVDRLPRNSTGKLTQDALRDLLSKLASQ